MKDCRDWGVAAQRFKVSVVSDSRRGTELFSEDYEMTRLCLPQKFHFAACLQVESVPCSE